jgi:hypothetical protein
MKGLFREVQLGTVDHLQTNGSGKAGALSPTELIDGRENFFAVQSIHANKLCRNDILNNIAWEVDCKPHELILVLCCMFV